MNYTSVTDEELKQIAQETRQRDKIEPRIESAHYEHATGHLVLQMRGGAIVSAPVSLLRGFEAATPGQISAVKVVSNGSALHWDELDVQATTLAVLNIVFGLRSINEVTRRGGQARTAAKAVAARENGKKGGRPRKVEIA